MSAHNANNATCPTCGKAFSTQIVRRVWLIATDAWYCSRECAFPHSEDEPELPHEDKREARP